jgi:hypothetical protein
MSKFEPCRSWACIRCVHYSKYLTVGTMQVICWNDRNTFEENK